MRDPKRIPEVLNELKGIWSSFPDLRLGQLLLNAAQDPVLYYLEDAELLKVLRDHYSEVNYIEPDKSKIRNKGS